MIRHQIIHSHLLEDSYFHTLADYLKRLARQKEPARLEATLKNLEQDFRHLQANYRLVPK